MQKSGAMAGGGGVGAQAGVLGEGVGLLQKVRFVEVHQLRVATRADHCSITKIRVVFEIKWNCEEVLLIRIPQGKASSNFFFIFKA